MGIKITSEKDSKTIYLTFNDGPTPNTTPEILRILKKYDAKATFFVIGENVNSSPQHLQQIIAVQHAGQHREAVEGGVGGQDEDEAGHGGHEVEHRSEPGEHGGGDLPDDGVLLRSKSVV